MFELITSCSLHKKSMSSRMRGTFSSMCALRRESTSCFWCIKKVVIEKAAKKKEKNERKDERNKVDSLVTSRKIAERATKCDLSALLEIEFNKYQKEKARPMIETIFTFKQMASFGE